MAFFICKKYLFVASYGSQKDIDQKIIQKGSSLAKTF
jgi:hypothetical protein